MRAVHDQLNDAVLTIAAGAIDGEPWAKALRVMLAVKTRWLVGEVSDETLTEAAVTALRCCAHLHALIPTQPQMRGRWYAAALVAMALEQTPDLGEIARVHHEWVKAMCG